MHIITPHEDIEQLLAGFREIGGVIEYDFVESDTEELNANFHRQAIFLALERWNSSFKQQCMTALHYYQTNQELRRQNSPQTIQEREEQFTNQARQGLQSTPEMLNGGLITKHQLLGAKFILQTYPKLQTLSMREELIRLYCDVDVEEEVEPAYAYAFSDPPHGLSGNPDNKTKLFRALNHALFNDFAAGIEIYRWTTNWCSYFDDGKEWWGSYLWTVYNPSRNLLIVVNASTTD